MYYGGVNHKVLDGSRQKAFEGKFCISLITYAKYEID